MKKGDIVINIRTNVKGTVQWVIGEFEASIKAEEGTGYFVTTCPEDYAEWSVIHEAGPSFQSSMASLSDDELRAKIEQLRLERQMVTARPKKAPAEPKTSPGDNKLLQALAKLTPEQQITLKKKLGLL